MKAQLIYSESRVFDFLNKGPIREQLDGDTVQALGNGGLRLEDHVLYVRKNVAGLSGEFDLFTGGDTESQGTRNFNNKKLPKFEHFVIEGVKFGIKSDVSITDPDKIADFSSARGDFPAALSNGKFTVLQNDKPLLELEIFMLTTQTETTEIVGDSDTYWLRNLRLLRAENQFMWKIKCSDGESIPSTPTTLHVEVALIGQRTKLR